MIEDSLALKQRPCEVAVEIDPGAASLRLEGEQKKSLDDEVWTLPWEVPGQENDSS